MIDSQSLMRAAVFKEVGKPMEVMEIPVPEPKTGEVLVKVAACGVCHSDLHVLLGEIPFPAPAVLGHEISGTVVKVGEGVRRLKAGDRVVGTFIIPCGHCPACQAGRDDLCENFFTFNRQKGLYYDGSTRLYMNDGTPLAMYSMGGLAEYAVLPETAVYVLPETLPLETSAILGCAVMTSYGAVTHAGQVRPGDRVAVVAVGGVGQNVVSWAKAYGAHQIIAIDVEPVKLELALKLGATDVIHSTPERDIRKDVLALTDGKGVDIAFEALGRPSTVLTALSTLRQGGRLVAIGLAPGQATADVPITRLVRESLTLVGSYGARVRQDLPRMLDLTEQGAIHLEEVVTHVYDLNSVNEAYEDLNSRKISGRAIVRMGE